MIISMTEAIDAGKAAKAERIAADRLLQKDESKITSPKVMMLMHRARAAAAAEELVAFDEMLHDLDENRLFNDRALSFEQPWWLRNGWYVFPVEGVVLLPQFMAIIWGGVMQVRIKFAKDYEVRLLDGLGSQLIFVTSKACDDDAAEHARTLMDRHPSFAEAEVWLGMKLIRKV